MGLSSLDAALSGLRASQAQLNVISGNISNVGTPGYTRKILPQQSQAAGGVTLGVLTSTIIRNVNLNLEQQLWTQNGAVSSLNTAQTYLSAIQQFHGSPDSETSIAAQVSALQDSFSALSDSPSDPNLQNATIAAAEDTATKANDLADLITTQRNAAQSQITTTVQQVNNLLDQIQTLNAQIKAANNVGQTTADAEDKRDTAINSLSSLIGISTFTRSDGVVVVQTKEGEQMADDISVTHLSFKPGALGASSGYPASAAGLFLGDPATDPAAVDLTTQDLGGTIGSLLQLRDQTFPQQMAQVDEMAYQLASRMNDQGLDFFTDQTGNLPSNAAPDPTTNPPTPVNYTGFATVMQVNPAIENNHALLQDGTYGASLSSGDDQVIRRVIQFAFGDVNYQEADGQISLAAEAALPFPQSTVQNYFGIHSTNEVDSGLDLSTTPDPATLIATANGALAAGSDTFRMTFQDTNLGIGPVNLDVALNAIPNTGGDFNQDLISYINNTVIPASGQAAALTSMGVSFSENANGQFAIKSNAAITVSGTGFPNAMGASGLGFLGLAAGTTQPQDPYFDVQVGDSQPTRITINSGTTPAQLLAQLQAVPGLAVQDFLSGSSPDGILRIRPGDNYDDPDFGGDLKLIAGPGTTSNAGANAVIGAGAVPDGINIVSALFSSFTTSPLQDVAAVQSAGYASQAVAGSGTTVNFRSADLGPGANISTGISGADNVIDYAQQLVNQQSQVAADNQTQLTDQQGLQTLINDQVQTDSGVNLDEEMGNLIVVQNSYAASARLITAVSDMFNELLNAVNS